MAGPQDQPARPPADAEAEAGPAEDVGDEKTEFVPSEPGEAAVLQPRERGHEPGPGDDDETQPQRRHHEPRPLPCQQPGDSQQTGERGQRPRHGQQLQPGQHPRGHGPGEHGHGRPGHHPHRGQPAGRGTRRHGDGPADRNYWQPARAGGGAESGHHANHPEGATATSATSSSARPAVAVVVKC